MSTALQSSHSGIRKAAILLVLLGEEVASLIYRNLNETELQFVEKRISEERFAVAKLSNDLPVHGVGRAGL